MRAETALSAIVLLAACASPTTFAQPDEDGRILGTIHHYGDPVQVDAPSEVARGREFTVTVLTYGDGCVSEGDTDTEIEGLGATVVPFDRDLRPELPPNGACTDILNIFEHEAVLRFEEAGTATLTFVGLERPSEEVIAVQRTIEVR